MKINYYQVDSFTKEPYFGNPAGVIILDKEADEYWMAKIAEEMNLSETSFLYYVSQNKYNLRWFTPTNEVDLCGHATLAAAHILWEKFIEKNQNIIFETNSGELICKNDNDLIQMNFPKEEAFDTDPPKELLKSLDVNILYCGKNRFDYLVELESEDILKKINPDFNLLKKINARGIIITSKPSNNEYDFVSRFFAPNVGVNEDPVTGSAHCCLAPYWAKKLEKNKLKALQVSARRGILFLELFKDRVNISGNAITVFEGKILM